MNQFHNRNTQGVLFHKLYWLIWTPSQIVMGISTIWDSLGNIDSLSTWDIINTSYGIMTCALMAIYFIGFFSWKEYAWKALMTQLITNVIFAFVAFGVQYADNAGFAGALVIGTLLRCVPVGIYYKNRRHLFTAQGADMPQGSIFFGGNQPPRGNGWNQNSQQNQQWNNQQWQNPQHTQPQKGYTTPTAENPQQNSENTATCPFCGKKIKSTSNFCIYCGKKLK